MVRRLNRGWFSLEEYLSETMNTYYVCNFNIENKNKV